MIILLLVLRAAREGRDCEEGVELRGLVVSVGLRLALGPAGVGGVVESRLAAEGMDVKEEKR